jgi:glycosyltransferase involved in cell wall biosynthesis
MAVGRLVKKKGFGYLLQAVPRVLARHADARFVIAGAGDQRPELEALAASLQIQEHVLFTGHIPWGETAAAMALADVFVVPSIQDEAGNVDGLPNVLLEAMATGRAVVASRVAGIPEVIQDGRDGLLVPQKDVPALAEAICALLSDSGLRGRLGSAARHRITGRMTWTYTGQRIGAVLQRCAGKVGCV